MKKKGFTLIELLAVIIILAVVALIATPVVLNIVEKVRIKAAESSAKGYAKAVEYEILNDGMFKGINLDGEYDVIDNELNLKYQGDGPSEGYFVLSKNTVTYGEFCINGYPIKYENSIGKYAPGEISCNGEVIFTPPEGTIASELCKGAISYDEVTNINIEKAEDLACISYLSNVESKTFSGKTLSLISDIDFNDDNSYRDINNTQIYKDMNGNGVEEDIKTEFTTSKGFKPIGPSSSKPFSGTFEGYAFTLSNLYINRTSESNIGLFGYNKNGTIIGLNIYAINISGKENVGGLVGYSHAGIIKEVNLNGNIKGTGDNIGGIVGYINGTSSQKINLRSVLVNANVTGDAKIGGVYGSQYYEYPVTVYAIVESGTLTGDNQSYVYNIGSSSYCDKSYSSNLVVLNRSRNAAYDGQLYNMEDYMISTYDGILDTWIGGDNDSSGYYFDYDDNNKLIVKSIERDPFTFTLKGEGTSEDPYLINNYQQWKEATTKIKQDVYFKLNTDLDFTDKPYYAFGTNSNYLVSTIDGGYHKISNVKISGVNNIGLIGYVNNGTIKGLNLDNIEVKSTNNNIGGLVGYNNKGTIIGINMNNVIVTGNENVGGLAGYMNSGILKEISLSGSITGKERYVAGLVGYVTGTSSAVPRINSVIVNVNASGSSIIGGIYGGSGYKPTVNGIVETGKLTSENGLYTYKIGNTGYNGVSYSSNNVSKTSHENSYYNGTEYTLVLPTTVIDTDGTEIDSLSFYDSKKVLDTKIGGDNDNSGYYLDYNSTGDKIIVVPVGGIPGGTINPDEPTETPTIEIDSNYTMTNIVGTTDTEAPTCELYYVVPVSNGIRASFSCTDNSGAPTVRSLFDSTTEKSAATFDTIGTLKSGSVSGKTKTVISTWNVNNPISQPTPGTCYYFRYGGQDAQGNFSTYVTNICYTGFSN